MRSPALVIAATALCATALAALPRTPDASRPADVAVSAGPPRAASAVPRDARGRAARVEEAVSELRRHVREQSHPEAVRLAFAAYFRYRAENPHRVRKPYLYFVDYGLDNRTPRGYVFDMDALKLVEGPFTVAHGRGSSSGRDGVPSRFSNRNGSAASSLGLYLAEESYSFRGKSAGQRYRSIGLRLRGLSGRFNGDARRRGVVVHGAPYVTASRAGRSEGCPAMEEHRAQRLIPLIRNGGMVFLFSPRDPAWLRADPWLRGAVRLASAAR